MSYHLLNTIDESLEDELMEKVSEPINSSKNTNNTEYSTTKNVFDSTTLMNNMPHSYYEESFAVTFCDKNIDREMKKDPNYENGQNKATIKLLKIFCKERENLMIRDVTNRMMSDLHIVIKVMTKFANAKAELARLETYKETIDALLHQIPNGKTFKIATFNKNMEKTWYDGSVKMCKIILNDFVIKMIDIINKYYQSLTEMISSPDIIGSQDKIIESVGSISEIVYNELINLSKCQPTANINNLEFMDKFNKIYDSSSILINLLSNNNTVASRI